MKIGLFGGAFDPFHNGHLAICTGAVKSANLDKLIVIPTGNAPHKDGFSASFEDRYNMARLALEGTGFEISRYEGERAEISYSAETAEHFHALYPDDKLFFIIGADSYRDFHTWHQPERIAAVSTITVFPRGGMDIKVLPPALEIEMKKISVSSTALRRSLAGGEDVSALVPERVLKYIKEHNLYVRNAR